MQENGEGGPSSDDNPVAATHSCKDTDLTSFLASLSDDEDSQLVAGVLMFSLGHANGLDNPCMLRAWRWGLRPLLDTSCESRICSGQQNPESWTRGNRPASLAQTLGLDMHGFWQQRPRSACGLAFDARRSSWRIAAGAPGHASVCFPVQDKCDLHLPLPQIVAKHCELSEGAKDAP